VSPFHRGAETVPQTCVDAYGIFRSEMLRARRPSGLIRTPLREPAYQRNRPLFYVRLFLLRYPRPSLSLRRLDKERRRRRDICYALRIDGHPACSCSTARSTVDGHPRCSFSYSTAPPALFLLLGSLRLTTRAPPPTRGDRSLSHQLATEAAAQGDASGPSVEAL
jgi:hypothetical protein